VVVITHDDGGPGLTEVAPANGDAVVLCDHDAPDARQVLLDALASEASYVAMMASRGRSATLLRDLAGTPGLDKLHVPAGLDVGGKGPGEIALSVVAEIVAEAHGRSGGPMRSRSR
jgi:xanthine dehydrogenase accessory factor